MKKIILLLLLVLVSITASARKSYITVYSHEGDGAVSSYDSFTLTGDVPEDIEGISYAQSGRYWYGRGYDSSDSGRTYSLGEILTLLSEYGYEVEFVENRLFLLSKEIPSGQTQIEGDVNNDSEVNIADVNRVISLILDKLRENPKLLEELGIVQPK